MHEHHRGGGASLWSDKEGFATVDGSSKSGAADLVVIAACVEVIRDGISEEGAIEAITDLECAVLYLALKDFPELVNCIMARHMVMSRYKEDPALGVIAMADLGSFTSVRYLLAELPSGVPSHLKARHLPHALSAQYTEECIRVFENVSIEALALTRLKQWSSLLGSLRLKKPWP